jgi:hypothetical protein
VYKSRCRSVNFGGDCVDKNTIWMGLSMVWLLMVSRVGNDPLMWRLEIFLAGRGLGRGRCGVDGSVGGIVFAGRLDAGNRLIVCVGSWHACRMPGTRMCWRLSRWRSA